MPLANEQGAAILLAHPSELLEVRSDRSDRSDSQDDTADALTRSLGPHRVFCTSFALHSPGRRREPKSEECDDIKIY